MTLTNATSHRHPSSIEDVAVEHAEKPESTQNWLAGKGRPVRRIRFSEEFSAGEGTVRTGSIALSFAEVSRRRWPL